jgi:hypothetical protein
MQEIDYSGINNVSFYVKNANFKMDNKICVVTLVGSCEMPIIETYSQQQFLDLYYKMQEIVVELERDKDEK